MELTVEGSEALGVMVDGGGVVDVCDEKDVEALGSGRWRRSKGAALDGSFLRVGDGRTKIANTNPIHRILNSLFLLFRTGCLVSANASDVDDEIQPEGMKAVFDDSTDPYHKEHGIRKFRDLLNYYDDC